MKDKDTNATASSNAKSTNYLGAAESKSSKSPNQNRKSNRPIKGEAQKPADPASAQSSGSNAVDPGLESKQAPKQKPIRKVTNPLEQAEYFGKQYTKSADLPDPGELLKVLACGIVQVLAGERPVDQLAKMVTADLYAQLRDAALVNMRKRLYSPGKPNARLQIEVRRVRLEAPRDGVIESVVLLHSDSRTRAVAIRLEGLNARWQATMVNVL